MKIFESFGLTHNPFSEAIEPEAILMDGRFRLAFDALELLPEVGTIGSLTGRTGVGKTTLLRQLIKQWRVLNDVYYLHTGNLHSTGLFRSILVTLGEQPRMGKDRMFTQLYDHLSRKQRPLCLIIDDSQLLDMQAMTDLRVLCGHLELSKRLILVLVGQPKLNSLLQSESLRDLRERMNVRCHLSSMKLPETFSYMEHRLKQAGSETEIFDEESIKLLHHHGEGVPRRIQQTAIKAMMNAWNVGAKTIDSKTLREACAADRS
jgi:type II secretory pathway predicted ATPase ExeA